MQNVLNELGHGTHYDEDIAQLKHKLRVAGREHSGNTRFGEFCSLWVVTQPDIGEGMLFKYRFFSELDEDESGKITAAEIRQLMNEEKGRGLSEERIQQAITDADNSGDGKISFMELCEVMP